MAIDLAALKAKLAAQKAAATTGGNANVPNNNQSNGVTGTSSTSNASAGSSNNSSNTSTENTASAPVVAALPTVSVPDKLGTSKTTEIDHIDFITKMNSLSEAIHKQHPTMLVLLKQIHTQLRSDPELVTTLDDDAIGIIVRGLQVQTKTELVVAATKPTRAKKGVAINLDML